MPGRQIFTHGCWTGKRRTLISTASSRNLPNLLDGCLPGRLFQIDGNFGGTADARNVDSEPRPRRSFSCQRSPRHGTPVPFRGLRARGLEIDLEWKDRKPIAAHIHSLAGQEFRFEKRTGVTVRQLGNPISVTEHANDVLSFTAYRTEITKFTSQIDVGLPVRTSLAAVTDNPDSARAFPLQRFAATHGVAPAASMQPAEARAQIALLTEIGTEMNNCMLYTKYSISL